MDYLTFFGFEDAPFRLTPDPQYFFPSLSHEEALQTLLYSIRAGEGFIQITGDPGTGKTLLLRTMLKELGDDAQTALILNPNLSPQDLLRVILDDFAITNDDDDIFTRPKDQLIRLFRDFLLQKAEEDCKVVIIVDEAQNLPLETIEELRLLSNLETDKQKLLQIFLVGQRELEEKIEDPGLRQLSQRITIRYCLRPFGLEETTTYIHHRLKIAAPNNPVIFSTEIIALIYRFSQGTPRLINIICERTLMAAYIDGQTTISKSHFNNAQRSIKGETAATTQQKVERKKKILRNFLLFGLILIVAVALFFLWQNPRINIVKSVVPTPATEMKDGSVAIPARETGETTSKLVQENTPGSPQVEKKLLATLGVFPAQEPLLIARKGDLLASLWFKEDSKSKAAITDHLLLPQGLHPGLATIGLEKNKPFIFNPLYFLYGEQPQLPSNWNLFFNKTGQQVMPLIILPAAPSTLANESAPTNYDEATKTGNQLRQTIKEWATAWRELDIETFMTFYAPIISIYKPGKLKPSTYEKEKLKKINARLFQKTKSLELTLSEPLCFTDPLNPNIAMAFFQQNYKSNNYRDKGYKTLFLSRIRQGENAGQWKITAKFFVPIK